MTSYILDDLKKLLIELNIAYSQSDIKKYCQENGKTWNYSLITSTLQTGCPLILGFNWGAAQGETYDPQTEIKAAKLKDDDLGSFKRIIPYCEKYFDKAFLNNVSQSNYCFFRSSNQSEITENDLELCNPIFHKLLKVIQPSVILCFSSKLRDHLFKIGVVIDITHKEILYWRGKHEICYQAYKGIIGPNVNIYFLPHPNYPMKKRAREEAWEFCFNKISDS